MAKHERAGPNVVSFGVPGESEDLVTFDVGDLVAIPCVGDQFVYQGKGYHVENVRHVMTQIPKNGKTTIQQTIEVRLLPL